MQIGELFIPDMKSCCKGPPESAAPCDAFQKPSKRSSLAVHVARGLSRTSAVYESRRPRSSINSGFPKSTISCAFFLTSTSTFLKYFNHSLPLAGVILQGWADKKSSPTRSFELIWRNTGSISKAQYYHTSGPLVTNITFRSFETSGPRAMMSI